MKTMAIRSVPAVGGAVRGTACALLVVSPLAYAHVDVTSSAALLDNWPFSWDAALALVAATLLYTRGIRQMREKSEASNRGRHLAFYAGLAAILLALLTPLDLISEHVFAVHQIQHLLLRGIAPMLLMLAVPSTLLIAGMPAALRRRILVPIMTHGGVRALFHFLSRPLLCTVLYISTLYLWQVPTIHNAALMQPGLHYVMHVTMLATGLLFFWTIFDPHPAPWGAAFQQRLVMLGAALFANIPLGAVITLKDAVSYAAYDQLGRWWGVEPLNDELLGGLVIWILASMMGLPAVLLLLRRWGQSDAQRESRRIRGFKLPPDGEDRATGGSVQAAAARRRLGWGLALVPVAVLVAVLVFATWLNSNAHRTVTLTQPAQARAELHWRPSNDFGDAGTRA